MRAQNAAITAATAAFPVVANLGSFLLLQRVRSRTPKKTNARILNIQPGERSCQLIAVANRLVGLTTRGGKPFSPGSFANWFREMCNKAGLSGLSAHGLRKAACRRLAEAGCSANVIAAISGHASLREVQRYTAAADQARMARTAIESMMTSFPSTRTSGGKPEC
jgi:integrase